MKEDTCPECLGLKEVFNGKEMISCTFCHGIGTIVVDDEDEFYESDTEITNENPKFIQFDEDKHSQQGDLGDWVAESPDFEE